MWPKLRSRRLFLLFISSWPDDNGHPFLASTGLLMLVSHPTATHITFTLLEAENGRVIRQHQHRLQTRGSIQVVELFRHKIFLKQEATPLVIYDVCFFPKCNSELGLSFVEKIYSGAKQVVNTPPFIIPSGYILMHEKHKVGFVMVCPIP